MDPATAIGLASAILSFVEFSAKIIKTANEIRASSSGAKEEHEQIGLEIGRLDDFIQNLNTQSAGANASLALTRQDKKLLELKNGCTTVSGELQRIMESVRLKNPGSKSGSVKSAFKTWKTQDKIKDLESRLDRYRQEVLGVIVITLKGDISQIGTLLKSSTHDNENYHAATMEELRATRLAILKAIPAQFQFQRGGPQSKNGIIIDPSALDQIKDGLTHHTDTLKVVPSHSMILNRLWFESLTRRQGSVEKEHKGTFRWLLYDPSTREVRRMTKQLKRRLLVRCGIDSDDDDWIDSDSDSEDDSDDDDRIDSDDDSEDDSDGDENTAHHLDAKSISSEYRDRIDRHVQRELDEELEKRGRQKAAFGHWLRWGEGVFHISGKAGSGKSTLMKYLARENKTHEMLEQWAEESGKKLIFARFFFWSSGDELQRSLDGLYRTILWDVLSQRPDLIAEVFPDIMSSKNARRLVPDSQAAQTPFERDELQSALDRLMTLHLTNPECPRLCLFIDGLDEYNGDYWRLSQSLLSWSSGNVKFCVSSRPYTEFVELFQSDSTRYFQLHDLTRFDMYQFVSSEFSTDGRVQSRGMTDDEAGELVSDIVDKADGIFLWIRLVTNQLLKSIGNHCSSAQLREKLTHIPQGLNELFSRMLENIDESEQMAAAQTLLILEPNHHPSSMLYVHWILDELRGNPHLVESIMTANLEPQWSYDDWVSTCQQSMASKIVARCQGLVEISHSDTGFDRVTFTHRSVADFLRDDEVQSSLQRIAGCFDARKSLVRAMLAWIKFQIWPSYMERESGVAFSSLVLRIVKFAESTGDVDHLVRMCTELKASESEDSRVFLISPSWRLSPEAKYYLGWSELPVSRHDIDAVVTCGAILPERFDIVLERLEQNPSLLSSRVSRGNILLATVWEFWEASETTFLNRFKLLDGFIGMDECDINAPCGFSYHADKDPPDCRHRISDACIL